MDERCPPEQFLDILEQGWGSDLSDYAQQLVYGTDYPDFHYTTEVRKGADGVELVASVTREPGHFFRYRLTKTSNGYDVRREAQNRQLSELDYVAPLVISQRPQPAGRRQRKRRSRAEAPRLRQADG